MLWNQQACSKSSKSWMLWRKNAEYDWQFVDLISFIFIQEHSLVLVCILEKMEERMSFCNQPAQAEY